MNVDIILAKHETVTVSAPIECFNQNMFCSIDYQRLLNTIAPIKIDNVEPQIKIIM